MSNKTTTNLANFIPKGELGQLFVKARAYNLINNKLISLLPSPLKTLSLCVVEDNVATLVHQQSSRGVPCTKTMLRIAFHYTNTGRLVTHTKNNN